MKPSSMTQVGGWQVQSVKLSEQVWCAGGIGIRPRAGDFKVLIVLVEWQPWECGADQNHDF